MFHVELRQFPHVTRAFNLTAEQLELRFVGPWVAGRPVMHGDRQWSAERARLVIYEAPELASEEMGLGRGWAQVTRRGREVTRERLAAVAQAPSAGEPGALEDRLLQAAMAAPVPLSQIVGWLADEGSGRRASELLAAAEDTVWALLHRGDLELLKDGEPVAAERWMEVVLAYPSWTGGDVSVRAPA